ncbi:hypothetical protein ACLEJQ_25115 [Pseudomonas sp. SMV71]|uniref:hypothetical protein n=1 Tax=Pseudomonas sp. SMV71 TaxID=3390195 RepID=UPI003F832C61
MLEKIKIAILRENQNIWFVRAEKGKYARHFRSGELIAINHLESAYDGEVPLSLPTDELLKARLLRNDKYSEFKKDEQGRETRFLNRSGFNLLSQVRRFSNEIKQGDLLVTRNSDGGYSVGICSDGTPYIEHSPVKIPVINEDGSSGHDRIQLKFKLRKHVIWGPSIRQDELPGAVRKATRGQQTVTCLNNHREKIFHLIYPFFTDGESLYFSNKIRTTRKINALVVGKLFQNMALTQELMSTLLNNSTIDAENFTQLIERMAFESELGVTCQAEFMSPGDMWCKIPLGIATTLPTILACVLACLIMTGQVSAQEIEHLQSMPPEQIINLKRETLDEGDIFTDKFKHAEASDLLKKIAQAAKNKSKEIQKLDNERSISEIKDNLKITVTQTNTNNLEDFNFGVNVLEIGRPHESH